MGVSRLGINNGRWVWGHYHMSLHFEIFLVPFCLPSLFLDFFLTLGGLPFF
jgi:hypothetical protein